MGKTKGYKQEYQVRWNNARLKKMLKNIYNYHIYSVISTT